MVLQEYKPRLDLAEFVRTFRLVHYDYHLDVSLPAKPYPPRPEHCLSFYARDVESVEYQHSGIKAGNLSAVVFGHQTEVTHRYVGNHFLLIQVVFQPGALYRITGIPSTYLTNQYIDAETIFSKDIKTVTCRINECHTYTKMIEVVENFLSKEIKRRANDIHSSDIATAALFLNKMLPPVDDLAKVACLSIRNLERHFQQRMGITPKYFLKVMRFEQAFRMRNKNPLWDWLAIAVGCGYYDYQHLARDYKELTGLTPNQFHEMDLHAPERIFGEADTY